MRLIDQDGALIVAVTVDELSLALNVRQPIIQWVLAKMAIEPESIDTHFTISPEILKEIRWRAVQAVAEERKAFFAKSSSETRFDNEKFRAALLYHCQAVERLKIVVGSSKQFEVCMLVAGVVNSLGALKEALL